MKLFFITLFVTSAAFAQSASVKIKDVPTDKNTTIEIKKGTSDSSIKYEITQGEDEIQGDSAPLLKQARLNWKKACADWKSEFKELNKENSILSMSCGTPACQTQTMETICTSKATYKLKVKMN